MCESASMPTRWLIATLVGFLLVLCGAGTAGAAMPSISAGATHTCAIGDTGGAWCWGDNEFGELGDGTTSDSVVPVPVRGLPSAPTEIVAADRSTCALLTDRTVWCWGLNTSGQLGGGSADGSPTPHPVPAAIPVVAGSVTISGGGKNFCAVLGSAQLGCWGENANGEAGDGTTGVKSSPTLASGISDVRSVSVGQGHVCAVINDGSARCWGDNAGGVLGDGTETDRLTPVVVQNVSSVASSFAGDGVSCAVIGLGDVRCWGAAGKLGNPAGTGSATAVAVPEVMSAAQLGGSANGVCPIAGGRAMICWGGNPGNGTPGPALGYSGVALNVLAVSASGSSGTQCFVVRGGAAFCWGADNSEGQLGTGSAFAGPSYAATQVVGLDLVTGRYSSSQVSLVRNGRAKVDKKRRYYAQKARLTATIPLLVGEVDGCNGTVTAKITYRYVKYKRSAHKRKRIKVKKTLSVQGPLAAAGGACVANVKFKLPVKYLNHKRISLRASWPGNAAIQPFSAKSTRFTLPKVKPKKKSSRRRARR